MNVKYEYYKIFYYVAKYGSFTKAAEILDSNQPNITRSMNNLEYQTGLKLFIRNKSGIQLTPEGKQLYEHISVAVHHISQAEVQMQMESELLSGYVIIGVSDIALREVLIPALFDFHKKYPQIKVQLINHSTSETIELLKKGMINFAIVTTPFEIHPPLTSKKIMDFHDVLIAGEEYNHLKKGAYTLEELNQYPWVSLIPGTSTRSYFDEFFLEHSINYEPQFLATTVDQMLPMIKAGLGIGFAPKDIVQDDADVFEIKLKQNPKRRSVHYIIDKEYPLSAASKKLIEMIEQ